MEKKRNEGKEYRKLPAARGGSGCDGRATTGEAMFVDDIPSPKNCLHGAYIYSEKPLARIRGIKLMPESQLDGVRDIISSKDIPNGGKNIGAKTKFGTEPLFAEGIARCVGECLAFVVWQWLKAS